MGGIAPDIGGRGGAGTIVRGPFAFAYNTPNLNTGVLIWTPQINEVLLDAFFEVITTFNGTTPKADIGGFVSKNVGLFGDTNLGVPTLAGADDQTNAEYIVGAIAGRSLQAAQGGSSKVVPAILKAGDPMYVVVSQTGQKGGLAIGGTTGAANLYVVTAELLAF